MTTKAVGAIGSVLTCALTACAPVQIEGLVVPGELSMIASVPATDPRLEGEGIEGAIVTAAQQGRSGVTVTETSDEKGVFKLPFEGTGALSHPMSVLVEAEGYLPAQVTMPTPTPESRLLVVLKPMRASDE